MATEAYGGGTSNLALFIGVSIFMGIFGVENKSRGVHEEPTRSEGERCRGKVTADVLAKGLSRGAIATRKLKGVKWDKGHGSLYWFVPLR